MATSNAFNTSNQYIKYKITVTEGTANVANNTSPVTVTVNFYRTNTGYESYGTGTVYCKINGITYSAGVVSSQRITSSGINLFTKTVTIPHNSDGSKTLYVSAWISHSVVTSSEQGFNSTLAVIPRASSLDSLTNATVYLNGTFTYKYTPKSANFYNRLRVSLPNVVALQTVNLGQKATSQQTATYTFTSALLESIYNRYPSTPTVIIGFVVETYSDSGYTSKIGESTELKLTLTIPLSVVPTISSVSLTENVAGIASKFSAFVQGKSKIDVVITAAGVYGSTIASYKTTILGIDYLGESFTSGILGTSGTATIVTTVTDTRGRTTTASNPIIVLAYQSPTINAFSAFRCNADGTENYEGTRVSVSYSFAISTANNLNDKYYEVVYRRKGTTSWGAVVTGAVYELTNTVISSALFSADYAYDLAINIYDFFTGASVQMDIPTAFTLIDLRSTGKGIAFGKVSESDSMEVALDAVFTKALKVNSNNVWHQGNDGTGSGLDADLLDGLQSSAFCRPTHITGSDGAGVVNTAMNNVGLSQSVKHAYLVFMTDSVNNLYLGMGVYQAGLSHKLNKISGELTAVYNNYGTISPTNGTSPYEFTFIFFY